MNATEAIKKADKLSSADLMAAFNASCDMIVQLQARRDLIEPSGARTQPFAPPSVGDEMRRAMEVGSATDVQKLRDEHELVCAEIARLEVQSDTLRRLHDKALQREASRDLPKLHAGFEKALATVAEAQRAFVEAWADSDAALHAIRQARRQAQAGGLDAPHADPVLLDKVRTVRAGPGLEGHSVCSGRAGAMEELAEDLGLTQKVLRDLRAKAAQEEAKQQAEQVEKQPA